MVPKLLQVLGGIDVIAGGVMLIWPAIPLWGAFLIICFGVLTFAYGLLEMRADLKRTWRRLRVRGPIAWNLDGFLGSNWIEGETAHVQSFQVSGVNRTRRSVEIRSAIIISHATGVRLAVKLKTDLGYVPAEEVNPIPSGATVYANALFDGVDRVLPARAGIPEDQFVADWGRFEFSVDYGKKKFRRVFSKKEILLQIARVKPRPILRPRITKKTDGETTLTK